MNSKQPSSKISVLTFNVWGLRVGRLSIARNVDARMEAIMEHIKLLNADVIALQEVWCDTIAGYFLQNLKYPYHYYAPNRKKIKGRYGNGLMFLSKFPILEQHVLAFSDHTRFDEYFANKGALMIQIETDGGRVNLFNTHLGAGKKISHMHYRMYQMEELQHFIRSVPRRQPVVLAGDFNFNPGSLEYILLKQWVKRYFNEISFDAYQSVHPAKSGHTYFLNRSYGTHPVIHNQDERIDYTFALCSKENRSSLTVAESDTVLDFPEEPLSDHCGVMTQLTVTRKSTLDDVFEKSGSAQKYEEYSLW